MPIGARRDIGVHVDGSFPEEDSIWICSEGKTRNSKKGSLFEYSSSFERYAVSVNVFMGNDDILST